MRKRTALQLAFLTLTITPLAGHAQHGISGGKPMTFFVTSESIGDGGNREEFATPWLPDQPPWSALREYAYGWGTLALNSTHLVWEWLRNDDPWNPPGERVGDSFVLTTRAGRK